MITKHLPSKGGQEWVEFAGAAQVGLERLLPRRAPSFFARLPISDVSVLFRVDCAPALCESLTTRAFGP